MQKLGMVLVLSFMIFNQGCACTTVEPGHVGVPVEWGEVQDYTYPEGFHMHSWFMDIEQMTFQTQQYTMAGRTDDESDNTGSITVLSKDQLSITVDVTVQYHLNPKHSGSVYRLLGMNYADTILHPAVRTAIRDAASEFDAVDAVSNRNQMGERMNSLLVERLEANLRSREISPNAIVVDDVLLRNISLPASIQESIARVQQQRQQGEERRQAIETARQEAERARIEAEGRAAVARINASRDAEVRLIAARSEAEANRTVAASLTPPVLRLREIEAQRAILSSDGTRTIVTGGNGVLLNLGTQ